MVKRRKTMTPLQIEKVNYILMQQCNIFHADMITRAIEDEALSLNDFIHGRNLIMGAERDDLDEFVPKGWEEV